MVTQCTACQVWFKVTREQLHAAHGLVRCSACGTVFNALATLRHDMPETHEASGNAATLGPGILAGPGEAAAAEPERESESEPEAADSTAEEESVVFDEAFWASVDLQSLPSEARSGQPDSEPEETSRYGFVAPFTEALPVEPGAEAEPEPGAWNAESTEGGAVAEEVPPPVLELEASMRGRPRPARRWLWGTVLGLLVVALAAQIVYARRESLATLFGITVGQRIALDRYSITDATLDSAPRRPGVLVLSGTLLNHADRDQPAPLIRVTLTDRYGDTVGARTLAPGQYGAVAGRPIKAHQRFMFHVRLADPGASAVGFSLVLCEHRGHSVWCQGS